MQILAETNLVSSNLIINKKFNFVEGGKNLQAAFHIELSLGSEAINQLRLSHKLNYKNCKVYKKDTRLEE